MQGRFLDCARNDGMGGWITHVPYKGYVGETPLPQRHPERSRGIFFVGGKRERARQREMGNTVSRKGGDGASPKRLSEGGGKRGRKRFLAALEMTVWGNGYPLYRIKCALGKCSSCITISRYARNDRVENEYPVHHTKSVWETHSSRIVIPSEAEGSFSLAARGRVFGSEKRETPYRGKTVGGASYKRLGEGGGKRALSLIPK